VEHTLNLEPVIKPKARQQIRRRAFKHASADAFEHARLRGAFYDDAFDPRLTQAMAQHQPGRARADDRNLGFQN
jgi:hypothetical protein